MMKYIRDRQFGKVPCSKCGPGSSVGIATDYGLDGPGIEFSLPSTVKERGSLACEC
jgi:hypothetical protein